jgi:hypothetical protein
MTFLTVADCQFPDSELTGTGPHIVNADSALIQDVIVTRTSAALGHEKSFFLFEKVGEKKSG